MKLGVLTLLVVASLGFVVGCSVVPAPGPEAVLEGTWSITPADPGEFEGFTYEARFNSYVQRLTHEFAYASMQIASLKSCQGCEKP